MAKKTRKKHPNVKKSEKYAVKGEEIKRKNKFCPKCGPGIFLAEHKNRHYCGTCSYTEWKDKGEQK